MAKRTNLAEEYVRIVNNSMFFREFTFTQNDLKPDEEKQEIELADSIVWIDEIMFLIQIKWRNPNNEGTAEQEVKWFKNKVLKRAKNQIKDTLDYFDKYSDLNIKNDRGFEVNLSDAPVGNGKRLIIYMPGKNFPKKERLLKFYDSSDVGLIHLLHIEDYKWICEFLITPFEILSYFEFRERMAHYFGTDINFISEELILAKFISGENITKIESRFIEYLNDFESNIEEFDVSGLLNNFLSKTTKQSFQTDYIPVVREIAKLSRFELKEFKTRFDLSIEKSKIKEFTIPYRITLPRNDVGFIFIPLSLGDVKLTNNWSVGLNNFTRGHKYDQKVGKCIGVTTFRHQDDLEHIEVYWVYLDWEWEYDDLLEEALKSNFPVRETKQERIGDYKFKKK